MLPIVIPMAKLEGVDPTIIALCLGTATSFAMLLVIGCLSQRHCLQLPVFQGGGSNESRLVATPILLSILVLVAAIWWKILGLV